MPYRSRELAFAEREATLERELQTLRGPEEAALLHQHRIAELEAELGLIRTRLQRPSRRVAIHPGAPCPKSWDEMRGDDRVRFCDECEQSVYNFAGLTHDEAVRLLDSKNGELCARLFRRWDGSIVTKDCPGRHWRHLTMVGIAVGIGVTLALASAAGLAASVHRRAYLGAVGSAGPSALDLREENTIPSYELDDVPIDLGEPSEP